MNWNALRSIADIVSVLLTFVSAGLLGLGCTDNGTKYVCDNANVPTSWVPILVAIAVVVTFGRMITKGFTSASGMFGKETKVLILFALFALWLMLRHALVA